MRSGRGEVSRSKVKKRRSRRDAVRKRWGQKGMKSEISGVRKGEFRKG